MGDFIINLSKIMRAEVDALNSIAQNSANVNTAGYKSIRSSTMDTSFATSLNGGTIPTVSTKVNVEHGKVNITDRSLDFAIMGDGWFGVQHKGGVKLTRNGNFKLNSENILTTQGGDPVLSSTGVIVLSSDSIQVDSNGMLATAEGEQFQLAIYKTGSAGVSPAGDSLYSSKTLHLAESSFRVLQGALENSNVDSAADMVRLMEVTRHIESMQRAINTYNELLTAGINEIGK